VVLNATPNAGYSFAGWYDRVTGNYLTNTASYEFTARMDTVVYEARFISAWGPVFTVPSNVAAPVGDEVTMTVDVSSNPGFAKVGLVISYDPNVLELVSASAPQADMPLHSQYKMDSKQGAHVVQLMNTYMDDWDGEGTVVNLAFNVKSTAPNGVSPVTLAYASSSEGIPTNDVGDKLNSAVLVDGSVLVEGQVAASEPPANQGNNNNNNNTGVALPPTNNQNNNQNANTPENTAEYGEVPQTGGVPVPALVAGLVLSLTVAAACWTYLGRGVTAKRKKDGRA
jgi:hypothetical protein